MKIETTRKLENKIFETVLKRVIKEDDINAEKEKKLENDFGPVTINATGLFCAKFTGTQDNISMAPVYDNSESNFKFSIASSNPIALEDNTEIPFSCDANKQTAVVVNETITLSPLQVAEYKCRLFEAVIKNRIQKAVEEWKKQQTNFEDEVIPEFEINLAK